MSIETGGDNPDIIKQLNEIMEANAKKKPEDPGAIIRECIEKDQKIAESQASAVIQLIKSQNWRPEDRKKLEEVLDNVNKRIKPEEEE